MLQQNYLKKLAFLCLQDSYNVLHWVSLWFYIRKHQVGGKKRKYSDYKEIQKDKL